MKFKPSITSPVRRGEFFSTSEAARALRQQPQSARAAVCRDGFWLGMIPVKLPNGRLLWPAADIDLLLAGELLKDQHRKAKADFVEGL